MKQIINQLLEVIYSLEKQIEELKSQLGKFNEKFDLDIQAKIDTRKQIIQAILKLMENTPLIWAEDYDYGDEEETEPTKKEGLNK